MNGLFDWVKERDCVDIIITILHFYCSAMALHLVACGIPAFAMAAWVGHGQIRWRSGYEIMRFYGDLIPIRSLRN